MRCARVLENVGQRFLGDAVGGQVNSRRNSILCAAFVDVDGEACFSHLGNQQVEVAETGLRGQLVFLARLAQHRHQAAQLGHRAASRRLDRE